MNDGTYLEIADDLRRRITEGEFAVGDQLPAIAALQEHYDVPSPGAIRQAQQILFDQGMVVTRQGVEVFVGSASPRARTVDVVQRLKTARAAIDDALAALAEAATVAPETATTYRCGFCDATLSSGDQADLESWADEHTDTEHPEERDWPNTFTVYYPNHPPLRPPQVYYRWPGGTSNYPSERRLSRTASSGSVESELSVGPMSQTAEELRTKETRMSSRTRSHR